MSGSDNTGLAATMAAVTEGTLLNLSDLAANNNSSLPYPTYYSLSYRVIGCLFVSLIFVIGFVGNIMVVVVVWRTHSMHTPTNCYLVSLAVADVLLLVSAPLPTIVEYFLIVDECVLGAVGCSVMVFTQYLGVNVSAMSITAFTTERYIAICHPMRAHAVCTVRRAKRIIAAVWTFGVFYCTPWLALTTTRTKEFADGTHIEKCTFKLERHHYVTYYMADLIIFYVGPLLLTCVLYALIARVLFGSDIASSFPRKNGAKATDNGQHMTLTKSSGRNSRAQVIKMLAIIVCMFAALWMPYRVYVVYNSFATQRFTDHWFILFCRLMIYMNSAINPILYNAMSAKFRRAFGHLLQCDRSQNGRQIGLVAFGGNRRNRIVISGTDKPISVSDEPTATQLLILDELPATQRLVGNTLKTPDTARLLYSHVTIRGDDKLATKDLLYGSCDSTEDAQVNDL